MYGDRHLRRSVLAAGLAVSLLPATSLASASSRACAAAAQPQSRAYSPMYVDGTLHVYATTPALKHIATLGGFSKPGESVATADGRKLYVNNWGTGELLVVDACALRITRRISVGNYSISSYIQQEGQRFDGRYLYVSSMARSQISVIDTRSDTIARAFSVPGLVNVHLSPDGRRLYALTFLGVQVLDSTTGQQVAPELYAGKDFTWATWATTSKDGRKLYLADTGGDALTIADSRTMRVIKRISLPAGTSPIVVKARPDGSEVWLANGASAMGVVVVSTKTDTITSVLPTNGMAPYISFTPDGRTAYLPEAGPNSDSAHLGLFYLVAAVAGLVRGPGDIRLIDTATKRQRGATLPAGQKPGDVATVQPGVVLGG
jgi:DNA-binding beta-propeller fold protein YncE